MERLDGLMGNLSLAQRHTNIKETVKVKTQSQYKINEQET